MPRLGTVAVVAGAALLARRAMRRRIQGSPLWPLPALEEPVSGRPRSRALRLTVGSYEPVAEGVVQLRLAGRDLPRWEPGAHLDLVLPSGLVRQYSLCGDPADPLVVHRRDPAGRGRPGRFARRTRGWGGVELEVRGPRNRSRCRGARRTSSSAGGIGITPVPPMLRALPDGVEWRVLNRGRTRASMPFVEEVEELGEGRVTVVEGRPDLGVFFADVPEGAAVYCCGPDGLMAAVEERFPAVHLERFAPRAATGGAFEVELRRSGRTLAVPADSSVLAAVREELPEHRVLLRAGILRDLPTAGPGRGGRAPGRTADGCGAWRLDAICVSRARGGRIVLDMRTAEGGSVRSGPDPIGKVFV